MIFLSNFKKLNLVFLFIFFIIISSNFVHAETQLVDVVLVEYFSQRSSYDQAIEVGNNFFELSGENAENNMGLSKTNIELHPTSVGGIINITNVHENLTLTSLNITLVGTESINFLEIVDGLGYVVYDLSSGNLPVNEPTINIYLTKLNANDTVQFRFNQTYAIQGEPLNFTQSYSSWKVLAGDTVRVFLNVTNSYSYPLEISDIFIRNVPNGYINVDGGMSYFSYSYLIGDDVLNSVIYTDFLGRTIIDWQPNGGTLLPGETKYLRYDVETPKDLAIDYDSSWASWLMMSNISSSFTVNESLTGINVGNITAGTISSIISISKERLNESYWKAELEIDDLAQDIDYNLTKVSVWATKYDEYNNPSDSSSWVDDSHTISDMGELFGASANATWWPQAKIVNSSFDDTYSLVFNYSLVPVVWGEANFKIMDDGTQIMMENKSGAFDTGYFHIDEIYLLLNGYVMKVTKDINPVAGFINRYDVDIVVENVGTEASPEWVSVFDLIPSGFYPLDKSGNVSTERNMTVGDYLTVTDMFGFDENLSSSNMVRGYSETGLVSGGPYDGFWGYHVDLRGLKPSSNGDGLFDIGYSEREFKISYTIEGNTSLTDIDNAYIIGVDPVRLDGANPSKNVISGFNIGSYSKEYIILMSSLLISLVCLVRGIEYGHKVFGGKKK